ncbi:MAG: hypothetical protein KatS3mg059_1303 [Thermomicrobiales bacterium]|nr:MAG: hypothetical protein KatS3mg059_1303 [Thermomicrobiales bacterium]
MTLWRPWWILAAVSLAIALAGASGITPPAGTSATPAPSCPAATPGATPLGEVGTPLASPTSPGPTPTDAADYDFEVVGGVITIRMTAHGFVPQAFQIAVGHHIDVTLVNMDSRPHTFTIESLHVDARVEPGQTVRLTISAPHYGDYVFFSAEPCDVGPEWRGLMRIFL